MRKALISVPPLSVALLAGAFITERPATNAADIWVTAYYAGWMQGWYNNGVLPAQEIDYSAMTHIIHFSLGANTDGTLRPDDNSIRPMNSAELITRAHAAGKKVLISVGGWNTGWWFREATGPISQTTFIANLITFMTTRGYDGIDIDWEPLESSDADQYVSFVQALRTALDTLRPHPLLTAAVAWSPGIVSRVHECFDQINIMTYDLSGAWPGWVSWHNAPIYDGGFVFPSTGRPVPTANRMVDNFIAAGVPAAKLGIGIDFYGYVWTGGEGTPTGGVTEPRQSWTTPPFVRPNVPYFQIWEDYFTPSFYRFDSVARVPYLSIDEPGSANDVFISFDDEGSIEKKIEYVREKGLGGVIVWELGGGYLPEEYPDRDRLLKAIKRSVDGTTVPPSAPLLNSPPDGAFDIPVNPRLSWHASVANLIYRIQISTDSLFALPTFDDSTLTEPEFNPQLNPEMTYFWRVTARNTAGWGTSSPAWKFTTMDATTSQTPQPAIPVDFALQQNYPNPFNAETWIGFDLPERSRVIIEVFSVLGQRVSLLANEYLDAGSHKRAWSPSRIPSGTYVYRMQAQPVLSSGPGFVTARKLQYVK